MNRKHARKWIAVCLSLALTISLIPGTGVSAARTLDDIRADQQALADKQAELRSQIESLNSETENSLEYQQKLKEEIAVVQEQINTAKKDIKTLDASIRSLDQTIKDSEKEYEATLALFKERLKTLYKGGSISTLEILLSADSFYDYSLRTELMKSVSKRDKLLMDEINTYMKSTEKERTQRAEEKAEVAKLKKNLEAKTGELAVLEEENQQVLDTLQVATNNTEQDLSNSYAYGDDLANQMAAEIAKMKAKQPDPTPRPTAKPTPEPTAAPEDDSSTDTEDPDTENPDPEDPDIENPDTEDPDVEDPDTEDPSVDDPDPDYDDDSIDFRWPCPGYIAITSEWGDGRDHKGLDMAADFGTPILAAESGTVMVANDYDSWGYSWGYYVSIYHDSTYSTLYAHCSSLAVSAGDYVEKGQVIAYVGNTGNSFGNHLHFEVYENGTRVDPSQFF